QQKIGTGQIEVHWEGSTYSHSGTLDTVESSEVDSQAWEKASEGVYMPSDAVYRYWDELEVMLLKDIASLKKMGLTKITSSAITRWYDKYRAGRAEHSDWAEERLGALSAFLEALFQVFLNEYKTLVERNRSEEHTSELQSL